jgi:hypothetical protein
MSSVTPRRTQINWRSIRIVLDQDAGPNPRNPYASAPATARDEAFRAVARAILLRKAAGVRRK